MTDPVISVSREDLDRCRWVAVERYLSSRERGHVDRNYCDRPLHHEAEGCLGELALSQFLGRPWTGGIETYKRPDLGRAVQVRATRHQDGGLILRNGRDKAQHVYVLAVILSEDEDERRVRLAGWIHGTGAMTPLNLDEKRTRMDGSPRWYVRQRLLYRPLLATDLEPWL